MMTIGGLKEVQANLQAVENREGDYLLAAELALDAVNTYVEEYEECVNEPGEFYYWDMMNEYDDTDSVVHVYPYGQDTARIIGQKEGGVIAYCHKDNADAMVRAFWLTRLA